LDLASSQEGAIFILRGDALIRSAHEDRVASKAAFWASAAFLILAFLFGGASRADSQAQLWVRLISVAAAAWAIIATGPGRIRSVRAPLLFLAALAALIASHLIAVPADTWAGLAGRSSIATLMRAAEIPAVPRSLTLEPDLAINSLLALLPALAAILLASNLEERDLDRVLMVLLGLALASGLLAILQLVSGSRELYPYRITNFGSGVGLFANRNHQAVMLALTLPMLLVFARRRLAERQSWRRPTAYIAGALVFPLILVTGSRAGVLLAGAGLAIGFLVLRTSRPVSSSGRRRRRPRIVGSAFFMPVVGAMVLMAVTTLSAQAESIQRLFGSDLREENRLEVLPDLLALGSQYFPVGAGFGSFVSVYRMHERTELLSNSYLNHAHNDYLELLIEGGLPAMLLLGVFAAWYLAAVWRLRAGPEDGSTSGLFGRLGAIIIAVLAAASVVDYPLRTPALSVWFAVACCWLAQGATSARRADARASNSLPRAV
jgi:O-antigen ligase